MANLNSQGDGNYREAMSHNLVQGIPCKNNSNPFHSEYLVSENLVAPSGDIDLASQESGRLQYTKHLSPNSGTASSCALQRQPCNVSTPCNHGNRSSVIHNGTYPTSQKPEDLFA